MKSDTSERGLERLICTALTGHTCDPPAVGEVREPAPVSGSAGWICGNSNDYDREYCVDLVQLEAFLRETQPKVAEALSQIGMEGVWSNLKRGYKLLMDEKESRALQAFDRSRTHAENLSSSLEFAKKFIKAEQDAIESINFFSQIQSSALLSAFPLRRPLDRDGEHEREGGSTRSDQIRLPGKVREWVASWPQRLSQAQTNLTNARFSKAVGILDELNGEMSMRQSQIINLVREVVKNDPPRTARPSGRLESR